MSDERNALAMIFGHLLEEGRDWYRKSGDEGASYFNANLKRIYSIAAAAAVDRIQHIRRGQFASREVALLRPPKGEPGPLLMVWIRWDFEQTPAKCGYYTGLWTRIDPKHRFIGFRFETPEVGNQHDFYHSQPCRNLGDRSFPEASAVPISEHVPTFALHATNSAELALNVVLSMRGKRGLEDFRRDLFVKTPAANKNPILLAGFRRLKALPSPPGDGPILPKEIAAA